jgi:hypothetical protein
MTRSFGAAPLTRTVQISINGCQWEFLQVPLTFSRYGIVDLFAKKNNKTLAETLQNRRYAHLSPEVQRRYPSSLNDRLGTFLCQLKTREDSYYLRFLNEDGDSPFCVFSIEKTELTERKGVYFFAIAEDVKYVGKTHLSFTRRINPGYGHISPKNCYLDGQSTNCHVNPCVARSHAVVALFVCPIEDDSEIDQVEKDLIEQKHPEWNR